MDKRNAFPSGTKITLGAVIYEIRELIGCGANAMVYKAVYKDELLKDKLHTVLIKELFPFHKEDLIYRGENGSIITKQAAQDFFELHKKSFIRGNISHIDLQNIRADKNTVNINSYEANNTLYTVMAYSNGQPLSESAANGTFKNLYDIIACVLNILNALKIYHNNNILHLDISPDNILLMPLDEGKKENSRNVLLIDYNSVWNLEELTDHMGLYYSIKEHYTAPEVKLHDYRSVCRASDIFSVCAILYEYVNNKPLETDALISRKSKPADISSPVLKNCPATVAHKLTDVLRRGLKLPAKQRYQNIAEIEKDLYELLDRINGVGITHSALWEVSRSNFHSEIYENPAYAYLNDDSLLDEKALSSMYENKHNLLIGGGGMGKTTALLHMWKNGIQKYNPAAPVPVYVPLYNYKNGSIPFIKGAMLEKLKFDIKTKTITQALKSLDHTLDSSRVLLLLDGFNEITEDVRPLLLEIAELMDKKGVSIVLTSRTDNIDFVMNRVNLNPLEYEAVGNYLVKNEVLFPSDENLLELLKNPMMLNLYMRTCQAKERNINITTEKELLAAYLDGLIASHRRAALGKEDEIARAEFSVRFLLPYIANAMKDKYSLNINELYKAAQICFQELQKKSFRLSFPEFTGKATLITGGAKSADEWFNNTIHSMLKNKFALLWQDETGDYRFPHQNIRDYLKNEFETVTRKLKRTKVKRAIPFTFAVTLLIALLTFGTVNFIGNLPKKYPKTTEEIKTVNLAMNNLVSTMSLFDRQIYCERRILAGIKDDVLNGDEKALEGFGALVKQELKAVDAQVYNTDESRMIINYLTDPRTTIPLNILSELYDLPAGHREELYFMLDGLEKYLSPSSNFSYEDKQRVVVLYKDLLDAYVTIAFTKMQQAVEPMTDDARKPILDAIPRMENFGGMLLGMNWDKSNFERVLNSANDDIRDILFELQSLGFKTYKN